MSLYEDYLKEIEERKLKTWNQSQYGAELIKEVILKLKTAQINTKRLPS